MRRSRVFLALTIVFGVVFGVVLVTTMGTPGRTAATAASLTAVLAGISLILGISWEVAEDHFEIWFEVKPPLWRLRESRDTRSREIIQFIVGTELRKRAEKLQQALQCERKAELGNKDAQLKVKFPPFHGNDSASIEVLAAASLNLSKARRGASEAKSAYNRIAKSARRFGFWVCKSHRDYIPQP